MGRQSMLCVPTAGHAGSSPSALLWLVGLPLR